MESPSHFWVEINSQCHLRRKVAQHGLQPTSKYLQQLTNERCNHFSDFNGDVVEEVHVNMIGWAAAIMTFIAYAMKTMLPLRAAAILSNILFILFGFASAAIPILVFCT